jgi:hypothetical protein
MGVAMTLKRWGIPSFVVDTDTELLEAEVAKETVLFSLFISNNEADATAAIEVKHTDDDGTTVLFKWRVVKYAGESPTAIDSPIVLEPGDKIFVKSDKESVSVLASGESK